MICVKFKNHEDIQCGRDMVKLKSHLGIKTFANIFGVERRTLQISHDQREHEYMCGAKNTARGSGVHKLFKVFQLYTSQMYSLDPPSLGLTTAETSRLHSSLEEWLKSAWTKTQSQAKLMVAAPVEDSDWNLQMMTQLCKLPNTHIKTIKIDAYV